MSACPAERGPPDAPPTDAGETADAAPADTGASPFPEVCPEPSATPTLGDANGDGALDVADTVALTNHLFRGGPPPVCEAAADFNGDGRIEADDAHAISSRLVSGTQRARGFSANTCASATPWEAGPCSPLAFELIGPSRVTDVPFRVELAIGSSMLPIEGWSASITAEGCTIAGVTTDGTAAAEIWDDPPGVRHLGYSASTRVTGGAITYTVLSLLDDVVLEPQAAPVPVLAIDVNADVPAADCTPCTLRLTDDLSWQGQPIRSALVAGGRSYRPTAPAATIQICAP